MTPMQKALNLRTQRERKGITRQQIADYVGVSPSTIGKWETNKFPKYGEERYLEYFQRRKLETKYNRGGRS